MERRAVLAGIGAAATLACVRPSRAAAAFVPGEIAAPDAAALARMPKSEAALIDVLRQYSPLWAAESSQSGRDRVIHEIEHAASQRNIPRTVHDWVGTILKLETGGERGGIFIEAVPGVYFSTTSTDLAADPYDSWILAGSKLFAKLQTLAFGQRVAFDGFVARLVMGPADKPQAVGLIVKFTDIRPAG
jgi:hypothetical protein